MVAERAGELSVQVTGHLLLWWRFPLALPTAHRVRVRENGITITDTALSPSSVKSAIVSYCCTP